MAFNPFSWFREHQKAALVALTILTMIIFIGQFGQGDPVGQVLGLFGANRASGEVVAKLYGKKVREGDITRTSQRRRLATEFLSTVTSISHPKVLDELKKAVATPSEGAKLTGIKEILATYEQNQRMLAQRDMLLRQFGNNPQFLEQFFGNSLQQVDSSIRQLETYLPRAGMTEDDKSIINRAIILFGAQRGIYTRFVGLTIDGERPGRDMFYFGGTNKPEDVLDFRLWLIQADRLGVTLTEEDVLREITNETAGGEAIDTTKAFAEQDQVTAFLGLMRRADRSGAVAPSELLEALRDEFRVVIAQSVLLGAEPGMRGYRSIMGASSTPSLATPDEFLRFLREQRTALRVKLYPINSADFVGQVKSEPSETEINARYERGAKVEPNPELREPGFKRPRQVQVQYVVASAEDPYYIDQARKDVKTLTKLASPEVRLANAMIGGAQGRITALATICLDPLGKDLNSQLYDNPDQTFRDTNPDIRADYVWFQWRDNPISDENMRKRLHFSSLFGYAPLPGAKPEKGTLGAPIAALIGGAQGGPLSAITSLVTAATGEELRQSIPFNLTLLLAQSDPQQLFGAAGLAALKLPPAVSPTLLLPQVLAAKEKSLAAEAVTTQMKKMQEELAKIAKKPKSEKSREANAYIAKAVKEYHLSLYTTPAPSTEYGMVEDLRAKKNLNLDILRKALGGDQPERIRTFVLRDLFGQNVGDYLAEGPLRTPDAKQEVLYWRSFDKASEERPLSAVRDEVVAAWRLDRARSVARDKAEAVEAEVNKLKANAGDVERLLREKGLTTAITLEGVSQLVTPPIENLAARTPEFRQYMVPTDKLEELPYAPFDVAKQLLRLKRTGEAVVIADRPARTFYVAVLLDRNEPTLEDFRAIYSRMKGGETLYQRFIVQRRAEYRKSVVEQLRLEAAGELDKEGRFKLPDVVRRDEGTQDVSE